MDQSLGDLYTRYVRAADFFNAQVDRKYRARNVRALFHMKVLTEQEFPPWWAAVSADTELQRRWLERFEDPQGSFERSCRSITEVMDQIPIRRIAA